MYLANFYALVTQLDIVRGGVYLGSNCRKSPPYSNCQQKICIGFILLLLSPLIADPATAQTLSVDWAATIKLPSSEKPIRLFNGVDLNGWDGNMKSYWSMEDGVIVARNRAEVPVGTYLFTKSKFREFRLLFEVKQTVGPGYSPMHSALAIFGDQFTDAGDPFSYRGPLVFFCNDWGYYEIHGRKRLFPAGHIGAFKNPRERVGDWNQIELLVIGNQIRVVANGLLITDFMEEMSRIRETTIGLQLHSNLEAQEIRFRGLILSEMPENRVITEAKS